MKYPVHSFSIIYLLLFMCSSSTNAMENNLKTITLQQALKQFVVSYPPLLCTGRIEEPNADTYHVSNSSYNPRVEASFYRDTGEYQALVTEYDEVKTPRFAILFAIAKPQHVFEVLKDLANANKNYDKDPVKAMIQRIVKGN